MKEKAQGVAFFCVCVEQTVGFKTSKALDSQLRNAVVRRPWESLGPCREVLVSRVAVLEKETCGLGSDASGYGSSLPAGSKFPLNSHLFVAQWMCSQQLEWPSSGYFFSRRKWLGSDVGAHFWTLSWGRGGFAARIALDSLLAWLLSRASRMGGGWI